MELEEALDRLYGQALGDFTRTRNELSSDLRSSGDEAGAREVKSLRKPNLAAWALNQLARRRPEGLDELFSATERLRQAHRRVLGGGKPALLREATEARGRSVSELTKVAEGILTEAGHAASPSTLTAVSGSLVAAAADTEGAELLRKGRLTKELRAESVVDVGAGLTLIEGEAQPEEEARERGKDVLEARARVTEARRQADSTKREAREADAEARRLAREAEEAERRARSAAESAEFARRAAEARRAEAEAAAEELERAEADLRERQD